MDILEPSEIYDIGKNLSFLPSVSDKDANHEHEHTILTPQFYANLYTYMFVVSIVVFSIEGITQVVCSILFIKKTKNIDEVTWWLKLLCCVPNISWVCYIVLWYFFLTKNLTGVWQGVFNMTSKVSLIFNFGDLIRMVRVQVQLKTSHDSTKKIIASINRSKKIEVVIRITLVLYACNLFVYYFPHIIGLPNTAKNYAYSAAGIFHMTFITLFCFYMWKVNSKFAQFF